MSPTDPAPRPDDESELNRHGQRVGAQVPDWSRRATARAVSLQGRYVALEPLRPEHAPPLLASVGGVANDDLWTYRPTEVPVDLAAMTDLVVELAASTVMPTMAIVPEGGGPAGMVSYLRIEPEHGQVEVAGVLYGPALKRTRAATEAIHLLMRHAFDGLGYRRFEWKCDSLNEPSRRAAIRLGFTYEGRFRQHMVTKGRNRDTDWFSVTDRDWLHVRIAHERWLDPANFDEQGRQLHPLAR